MNDMTMEMSVDGGATYLPVREVRIRYLNTDDSPLEVDQSEREVLCLTCVEHGMVVAMLGEDSGDMKVATGYSIDEMKDLAAWEEKP